MAKASAFDTFSENVKEVGRLVEIHRDLTGDKQGRRFGVEILNKSAVVLLTACWVSFVEDLADEAFAFMLVTASSATNIPSNVRVHASRPLREAKDERRVWELSDLGWRTVLHDYRTETLRAFNTPKTRNIDDLFERLLDVKRISSSWYWQKMSATNAAKTLDDFVTLRGGIAHRVAASESVTKKHAEDYRRFTRQLALKTANRVRAHLGKLTGTAPWDEV